MNVVLTKKLHYLAINIKAKCPRPQCLYLNFWGEEVKWPTWNVSGKNLLGHSVWLKCHAHRPVLINKSYCLFIIHCTLFLFVLLFFFSDYGQNLQNLLFVRVCMVYLSLSLSQVISQKALVQSLQYLEHRSAMFKTIVRLNVLMHLQKYYGFCFCLLWVFCLHYDTLSILWWSDALSRP